MKKLYVIAILLSLLISCSSGGEDMPVNIGLNADKITVINTETKAFDDVRVKINGDFFFEFKRLDSKEVKEIYLFEFTDKKGNRFTADKIKVKDIYIAGQYLGDKYWSFFQPK